MGLVKIAIIGGSSLAAIGIVYFIIKKVNGKVKKSMSDGSVATKADPATQELINSVMPNGSDATLFDPSNTPVISAVKGLSLDAAQQWVFQNVVLQSNQIPASTAGTYDLYTYTGLPTILMAINNPKAPVPAKKKIKAGGLLLGELKKDTSAAWAGIEKFFGNSNSFDGTDFTEKGDVANYI